MNYKRICKELIREIRKVKELRQDDEMFWRQKTNTIEDRFEGYRQRYEK